nr:PREDICTED: segment polarity protein dishevelled homolog DVL-3-like [Paralichthys olivaceus]
MGDNVAEGTRVLYHLEDQDTPYLTRINVPAQRVTLADFKHVLNKSHVRFFFQSVHEDFRMVKEEISDDDARLPCENGRVVCWVVSCNTCQSHFQSVTTPTSLAPPPSERIGGSRPLSLSATAASNECQGSEVKRVASPPETRERDAGHRGSRPADLKGAELTGVCDSSSTQQSSELEMTSSSEDDSRGSCLSERYNFLGVSIVGQSNDRGDGGIYIGSIMKGGAVAADGRIEPGDMLLQVNDINFENLCNDDAVRVLRDVVHKPGAVTLTVAKCWDPNPRSRFPLPRSEPVRPIDPAAWVSHTAAMTGKLLPHYGVHEEHHFTIHSDITDVVKAMTNPESGLEVRDRMWLKITIPNAFIGSEVVDWLHHNVEGLTDRREARKYAGNLLRAGYIRHTINKVTFSEQCYYVFGDVCCGLGVTSLLDHVSSPGGGSVCDPPGSGPQWPPTTIPHLYSCPQPPHQLPTCGGGSRHSKGSCESNCSDGLKEGGVSQSQLTKHLVMESTDDDRARTPPSSISGLHSNKYSKDFPPALSPSSDQRQIVSSVSGARQSLHLAMGNPSDFFVDVM